MQGNCLLTSFDDGIYDAILIIRPQSPAMDADDALLYLADYIEPTEL